MILKFKTLNGLIPTRAHNDDAGYDIYAPRDFGIHSLQNAFLMLGVCVEIPKGYTGLILGRSSMNKKGIICMTGVIDSGYTGELGAMFFNTTSNAIAIHKGERICQLVIVKLADIEKAENAEKLESSERGAGGFGSTGI